MTLFTSAFVIAWTHPSPGGQVPVTREAAHIRANLRNDDLSRSLAHTRNLLDLLDRQRKRAAHFFDLFVETPDPFIQVGHVFQLLRQQPALGVIEFSTERFLQLWDFLSQFAPS